ncbi:MAG: HAD-IC family P-type ATPase, partial [Candidatus Lokiarchaeota archaeon]|nr:HAD-IC family P-type ATPase [Candidatus Lokiarchaeota archaeon]
MKYYNQKLSQIYQDLQTDPEQGLSSGQATSRLKRDGPNEIPKVSRGFIRIYLAPLFNSLILIYLIGALLMYIFTRVQGQGSLSDIYTTLAIVAVNMLVAIFQQFRATKKLKALQELTAPTTTVIRNGGERIPIKTKEVVVGDILDLQQGDKIPADARLIVAANLEVNEASLTGESTPSQKIVGPLVNEKVPVGDRENMVFFGTYVTRGTGRAIVVKTGANTEIGKISTGLKEASTSDIPIQKKMNRFGLWLGGILAILWVVIALFTWILSGETNIAKSLEATMDMMPINIPLLSAIVMITGVLSMAKYGVIIRDLTSVDSLGRISIVCSDKTGTLTESKMFVENVRVYERIYHITGNGYRPEGKFHWIKSDNNSEEVKDLEEHSALKKLLIAAFLNNNASIRKKDIEIDKKVIENWITVGSPTEGALVTLYKKIMDDNAVSDHKLVKEFPFDSQIKRMSKVFEKEGIPEKYVVYSKGASKSIIQLCSKVLKGTDVIEFYDGLKQEVYNDINNHAEQGYRVLSIAYKEIDKIPLDSDSSRFSIESNLVYLGFVTIVDPPREGVKDSVQECYNAGVDVVMITGDSPKTAKAIAKQ